MGIKHFVCVVALLAAGGESIASEPDSLTVKKTYRAVNVGPQYFDATPVDSALLRKLMVRDLLQKKNKEEQQLVNYQNALVLRNLLNETEISEEPNEKIIGTLQLVLDGYRQANDLKSQALIYNTYGVYYGKKGETVKAIQNFTEALKLRERLSDKAGMIRISENLAALYRMSGNEAMAVQYTENVVQLNLSLHRAVPAAEAYLELASGQLSQNKYSEAEYTVLKKALPMFTRMGNKPGRLKSFQSLAEIYCAQKKLSEAKWFYVQTNLLAKKLDDQEAVISSLIHLAEVKGLLGEHEMALDDYHEAERLAIQNNFPVKLIQIKGDLGETYNQMGNYLAAGTALTEYNRLRANLFKSVNL